MSSNSLKEASEEAELKRLHLQDYVEIFQDLPVALQTHLSRLHTLDCEIETMLADVKKQFTKDLERDNASGVLGLDNSKVNDKMTEILEISEKKVWEANKAYNVVDEFVRRADEDLRRFAEQQMNVPRVHMGPAARKISGRNASSSSAGIAAAAAAGSYAGGPATTSATDSRKRRRAGATAGQAPTGSRPLPLHAHEDEVDDFDVPIDPNEPRYCYCRDFSYGQMVACDGEDCEAEWFHLECVNLREVPDGKWYCRDCAEKMKKQKR